MSDTRRTSSHSRGQAHRIQAPIPHPQHNQIQPLPQRPSPRSQYVDNGSSLHRQQRQHRLTPHSIATRSVANPNWQSNEYVRHGSSNGLVHASDLSAMRPAYSFIPPLHSSPYISGSCEYVLDLGDGRYEHSYMGVGNNTNGSMSWIKDQDFPTIGPGRRFTGHPPLANSRGFGDSLSRGHGQLGSWAMLESSQTSIMDNTGENNPLSESDPSNAEDQPFLALPGYRGEKNNHGLFDCFEDCTKGRFGDRGFVRRANMLVHLRNCHGQEIPKGSRA